VDQDHQGIILLLSTSDTDLLAARASGADYRLANPARLPVAELAPLLDGADVIVVRLLGGEQAWPDGLAALRRQPLPLIVLGGEMVPDAALLALSSVPAGIAAQAHEYLAHGGPGNLRELAHFLADTVLLGGNGFAAPEPMAAWGLRPWPPAAAAEPAAAEPAAAAELVDAAPAGRGGALLPRARAGGQHSLRRRALHVDWFLRRPRPAGLVRQPPDSRP
jgi:cobalamin biosynthesis Mg chelatase CobN